MVRVSEAVERARKRAKDRFARVQPASFERPRLSLAEFVRAGWAAVEPDTPLVWNWHIDAICLHLEAVTRQQLWRPGEEEPPDGRIQDLLINVPPGHMKSLIVGVFWPAWEWTLHPFLRSLFASYALELAIRDSVRSRALITSEWYQTTFRPAWRLSSDQNVKGSFSNTAGGFRKSLSVGSSATGFRGHKVVVDDSLNATDASSDTVRNNANVWWDRTMSSRLNDPRTGARVSIQQRLHELDLTGHCLAKGGYDHLCLASEFDPDAARATSIGWTDPRAEHGELLFPALFTAEVLAKAKVTLGSVDYAGQHLQKPAPADGDVFKKRWLRFWVPPGVDAPPHRIEVGDGEWHECPQVELPLGFEEELQSWDCAFKDTKNSDFVCGQVWKRKGASAYLVDQAHGRMSFTATVAAVQALSERHPGTAAKLIEDKANGSAVIDALKSLVPGLVPVEPEGGKVARARASTPFVEAGNVYLPHPALFPWVGELLVELFGFPYAANDDRVDAMTQALIRMFVTQASHAPAGNPIAAHLLMSGVRRS